MKTENLLAELEDITTQLGYTLRKEKGNFRGDSCVLEGQKIVMVNKNHPPEFNIGLLSSFLSTKDIDSLYIKPAVRKELEKLWKKKGITPISQAESEEDCNK